MAGGCGCLLLLYFWWWIRRLQRGSDTAWERNSGGWPCCRCLSGGRWVLR
ncbi:hypothetical protein NC653_004774 [Populus alba x Populus x berolinensis]|uniref:Uncharacterized protein n=1 Tax=Populus alba x Populus x berolinensis TaxID=444605 RepID=A0AAD6WL64_9ROSI|nr:hypothetical protein NC653_004773 [Populus alba x Populus x berolinensis]KAJ7015576.1 hypothetical protein NC653_004774 [Populus alba x Populus x berolinensis]